MTATVINTVTFGEVLVIPHQPSSPINESLEWLNDEFKARSGRESFLQVRTAPRQFLTHRFDSKDNAQQISSIVHHHLKELVAVPIWQDRQRCSVVAGDQFISVVNTEGLSFYEDSLAILWKSEDDWELVEVVNVTIGWGEFYGWGYGGTKILVLNAPVSNTWSNVWLMPVRTARIIPEAQRTTTGVGGVVKLILNLRVEDNYPYTDPFTYDFYEDEIICPFVPESVGIPGVTDAHNTKVDEVDSLVGIVSSSYPWNRSQRSRSMRLTGQGYSEWRYIRSFLYRCGGKLGSFWMPSYEHDFTLVSTGVISDTFLVKNEGYKFDEKEYIVAITDDAMIPRKILQRTVVGDNLELVVDIPIDAAADDISILCFFDLMRLRDDRVEIEWSAGDLFAMNLAVTEVM